MDLLDFIAFAVIVCAALHTGSTYSTKQGIVGEKINLECPESADKTQVNWTSPSGEKLTRGEIKLIIDDRFEVIKSTSSGWHLLISNIAVNDSGRYTCVADNDTQQHVVELIVNKPMADDIASNTTSMTSSTTFDPSKCSDTRPCDNFGSCENGFCNCLSNFTGSFCEVSTVCDAGYCNINNTINCTKDLINGNIVNKCNCLAFYKGSRCEEYEHCKLQPCQNGGKCTLSNTRKGYECECRGLGDPNNDCKLNRGDDCQKHPPRNVLSYITCIDLIESYRMYCSPGNTGEGCRFTEDPALYCDRNGPGFCSNEGYCKPYCNVAICNGTENCNFTADPFNTVGFRDRPDCIKSFGDGYDHPGCNNESTLFDGFDAKLNVQEDCSPFFNTTCTMNFGNGDCNSRCQTDLCLWDGYDCYSDDQPEQDLFGVVIVEVKGSLENPLNEIQKNISLMLRSMVNITEEDNVNSSDTVLSLKIKEGTFTEVDYAGNFLAAAIAKRPGWLDRVKIKDIYVCPAGMYGYKCQNNCSMCKQIEDICNWKNGECLYGCPEAHFGQFCKPCDMCNPGDEPICDTMTGECLHGCKPRHWGDICTPCRSSCKQEGDVCNNSTGSCLYGCISNEFYSSECKQCPRNCAGGCDDKGVCNNCSEGTYGEKCNKTCDYHCQDGTCDRMTGRCQCQSNYYWSTEENMCERCNHGCQDICDTSGNCQCKDGYYSNKCDKICNERCLERRCYVNGTCVNGCSAGFYSDTCSKPCPVGCTECTVEAGTCIGHCKAGYSGSNCEQSSQTAGADDTTDNTGIIIGVIISVLLLCLILAVACCYWKKRQSGDYVMEDEEMEEPPHKDSSNAVSVHTNSHMQPSSPLLGHSLDMIELDEKQSVAVYAGPSREPTQEEEKTPNGNGPEVESPGVNESGDKMNDEADKADDTDKKERCTSSVVMEIGKGGRVLSVSDGDETQSPTLTKEVELPIGEESNEDDSAFADPPPHSPLGVTRAPLASEENILASLGPRKMESDVADQPSDFVDDAKDEGSNRSRSSSSSSSSSGSSSKSSKSSKSSSEKTTEM